MSGFLNDRRAEAVLERLYALDQSQLQALLEQPPPREQTAPGSAADKLKHDFLRDKLVALEPDKAEFCYLQCLALGARRVVECGTSFGVSTIYLAAAVRDNGNPPGLVIGTEYEPEKAKAARANWAEAGLTEYIDLREGDIRETIKDCGGLVDFVLMDIWTALARPALDLLIPQLARGAVIIADNIIEAEKGYADYLSRIHGPDSGFRSITLPFKGGLEFSVWEG
jgi:predicted O-methyltransferase YrrM